MVVSYIPTYLNLLIHRIKNKASWSASWRDKLAKRWLTGEGIEIGALHNPVKVKNGVSIKYLDYKTKQENQARYPELKGIDIVETDIVDDGFILSKVSDQSLDFIVANHALEHTPDPYGTLLKWKSKLKHSGLLYFAVPIAEKCYDVGRPITTLAHLLEDHYLFTTTAVDKVFSITEDHLREFLFISDANIRRQSKIEHTLDESEITKACADFMQPIKEALKKSAVSYDDLISAHVHYINKAYDLHYHTFSPTSLHIFVKHFCNNEGFILIEFTKRGGAECIVIIRKIEGSGL